MAKGCSTAFAFAAVVAAGIYVSSPAAAQNGSATADSAATVIYELLNHATSGNYTHEAELLDQKLHFTSDLNNFLSKATDQQWQDFDGDILTGSQEPESLRVKKTSTATVEAGATMIEVILACDHCSDTRRIDYTMKLNTKGAWQIDDITYFDEGKAETLRQTFDRLEKNAVTPEISGAPAKVEAHAPAKVEAQGSVVHANTYNYLCTVDGKTYPLRVDDNENVIEWMGKKYSLTGQPDCAKYGWHAEGNGTSFDFCTATQGYAAIEDKDGNDKAQCDLKR